MAYAVVSDITSEFKNLVLGTGKALTEAEVTAFIVEEEAVINSTIANRYDTPVTDSEAVAMLKRISIAFVAYRVAKILNLKKDIPIPEKLVAQDLSDGSFYRTAKNQLTNIMKGNIVFVGAATRSTNQGVSDYNSANSIESVWSRDVKQW